MSAKPNDGSSQRKLLRLIEALCRADGPARLGDIAEAAGLAKPTAHRLLGVLCAEGWAIAHDGGSYTIGPAGHATAARLTRSASHDSIQSALAELHRGVSQTIHLGMRSGDRLVYTHKVEGSQPFAMSSRVGMEQPLHSTGIGKCILAGLDSDEVAEIAGRAGLERRTARTITTLPALERELADVRERGYALDDEENEANVRCLAAPLRSVDGRTIGAVSISTVTFVVPPEKLLALAPALLDTTARVAELLA